MAAAFTFVSNHRHNAPTPFEECFEVLGEAHDENVFGAIRAPGCRRNAYVLIYVAKEIKNVGPEGTTHAFTKDHGVWKLSLSRTSFPKEE